MMKYSGFEVEFCDEIKKYYEVNISVLKKPHITASIAIGASGMNTKNLKFIPLKKPKKLLVDLVIGLKMVKMNIYHLILFLIK